MYRCTLHDMATQEASSHSMEILLALHIKSSEPPHCRDQLWLGYATINTAPVRETKLPLKRLRLFHRAFQLEEFLFHTLSGFLSLT